MICPLISQRVDYGNKECKKEKCAWWVDDKFTGGCAIKKIAENV